MKLLSPPSSSSLSSHQTTLFFFSLNSKQLKPTSVSTSSSQCRGQPALFLVPRLVVRACATKVEPKDIVSVSGTSSSEWGKVSAVLFDMDGVLCNIEEPSRRAGVDVFAEMGVEVTVEDFVPFMGTGEANFLGGVASVKGVKGFDSEAAKKRFFEIYLDKYAKPNSGVGFPGALELIKQCKSKGLKVAVASSADRVKVDANLVASGLPLSMFDAIVSADDFENLKPAPDIFLAASKILNLPVTEEETKFLSSRFIDVPRSCCFSTWVSRVQFQPRIHARKHFQLNSSNGYPLNAVSLQDGYAGNVEPEGKEASFPFSESENVESIISITVVGASGDLAKKKIFPALFALFYEDFLPEDFMVFGYARTKLTDEELRDMISITLTCRIDKRYSVLANL
ncbi:hypothetical protein JRO89_XS03G0318300 [Xanthoceras sorbifolium]|uniref:Glucose-6-phosphate dehydrogenase NAD-binding domain-containing protein n=1 Tax=Xanthoceras sorbifolium TaxID=99658 RepID=A0ABQ8IDP0_9ROSI|nr:hypothetical protein JRO89_XS03G0318300 [Xanthoceras sorbifolium]